MSRQISLKTLFFLNPLRSYRLYAEPQFSATEKLSQGQWIQFPMQLHNSTADQRTYLDPHKLQA